LKTILEEERHLQPVSTKDVIRSSVVIHPRPPSSATSSRCLLFLFLARTPALVVAVVLSALVLFGVGAYQAITRVGSWWRQGSAHGSDRSRRGRTRIRHRSTLRRLTGGEAARISPGL